MPPHEDLNLLDFQDLLKVKRHNSQNKVFDPIRKSWYILKPEEFVRQLVIVYLNTVLHYPFTLISVEKQLKVNLMKRRFDLVVYNKKAKPYILIECKSAGEKLNENTALQIASYNLSLKAKYLWLSNGRENLFYGVDYGIEKTYRINSLPVCG